MTPDGPVRGLDALRELFTGLTTELLPPGSEMNLINHTIEGEIAYVVWSASCREVRPPSRHGHVNRKERQDRRADLRSKDRPEVVVSDGCDHRLVLVQQHSSI